MDFLRVNWVKDLINLTLAEFGSKSVQKLAAFYKNGHTCKEVLNGFLKTVVQPENV